MKRSEFLSLVQLRRQSAMVRPLAALDPYSGPWTDREAGHLLKRLQFGTTAAAVRNAKVQGLAQTLEGLLQVDPMPNPPLNVYSTPQLPDPDVAFGTTFVNAPINAALPLEYYQARIDAFKAWWVGNLLRQKGTIVEKMTLFWHNHFAVEAGVVGYAQASHQYYALLRQNCLGNFKSLTKKITLDPAMLRYLNGYLNSKTAPDENYARELQELFTIGKGPDSAYTEDDVKAAARVLTGYRINPFVVPLSYVFDFTQHDTGNKTFSAFYNNRVITGKPLNQGEQELDELIDMIFSTVEVARHICRKLYRFFVYYEIDDWVEQNVIRPLADLLIQNNFEVRPILITLFGSAHFFEERTLNCVIKSPLDYAVGMCREFSIAFPEPVDDNGLRSQYIAWGGVASLSAYQGLNLGDPPLVAGWQAWYQQPQFHEIWINADSLANKNRMAENITSPNGLEFLGVRFKIDPIVLTRQLSNPYDAAKLVEDAVALLYNYPLSAASYTYFKNNLVTGFPNDSYWGVAWNAFESNPSDPSARSVVETRLNALYREILSQAEYHLC
ncbi:MAG: DUF1800 domain-containing protein [Saprospiraceae bacterium]|jgi:uncharacterized protein (DUF1800 family)|nr:DUF1800 domain-containing protein [Saprospiraceae bacterium]MBP9208994.1 DUF1800 domain-containing protein [Saprospiraceae bacterium]MBV6472769.1 hypothetical protein [Saprospiraceae bacterium]